MPYTRLAVALAGIIGAGMLSPPFIHALEAHADGQVLVPLFVACIVFMLGSFAQYATLGTAVPSSVAAVVFGLAAHPLLSAIPAHPHAMMALVSAAAAYILFRNGLETRWEDLEKRAWKIFPLSLLGFFVTSFLFSIVFYWLGQAFGHEVSLAAAVLAGAVLASADPTALIETLRRIRLREGRGTLKEIATAESTLTGVLGTLLVSVFVFTIDQHMPFDSIAAAYGAMISFEMTAFLFSQVFWGIVIGGLGYLLLDAFHVRRGADPTPLYARLRKALRRPHIAQRAYEESPADMPFFFTIPLLAFTVALAMHGSGYLAVFVAGLLPGALHHLHQTRRFFGDSVDTFFRPAIFVIVGCVADIGTLIDYAPIGIVAALLLMFVIRPIAVFVSLSYWIRPGRERMDGKDLLFLSFASGAGTITAALLITLVGLGQGEASLVATGTWVLLVALGTQPSLTPYVSHRLGLTVET